MPQYKVRPGFRHGVGKRYGPGDTVTLTEQEARSFLDKLELVKEEKKVVEEREVPMMSIEQFERRDKSEDNTYRNSRRN